MRADRLITILLLLQNHGLLTSRALAEKLEVSERTVHRDMEALSMAGIPVYAERGIRGGWRLAEGYKTSLTGLKEDELIALLFLHATSLSEDLGLKEAYQLGLQKLLAASSEQFKENAAWTRERLYIDGVGWDEHNQVHKDLQLIQEAVWQSRCMLVMYDKNGQAVERKLYPLGLVAKRHAWYLVAQADGEYRTYRVSRFIKAELLEEYFERPRDFNLASYWENSILQFKESLPEYIVVLMVHITVLTSFEKERFIRIRKTEVMEPDEEAEWVLLEVDFQALEYAQMVILSYGEFIRVIKPTELKAQLRQRLMKTLDQYATL